MKLVTFSVDDCKKVGALDDGRVIDLREARTLQQLSKGLSIEAAVRRASLEIPRCMISFIEGGDDLLTISRESVAFVKKNESLGKASYLLEDIKLNAPIPKPPMIINMGNAYRPEPITNFGFKPMTSVIGPGDNIVIPKELLDTFGAVYEPEIGTVIGKIGRRVPNDDSAFEYIYGYTIYNDITDYNLQMSKDPRRSMRKVYDTFVPMGPCIVTKDEIEDPHNLILRVWTNGLLGLEKSSSGMQRKIPEFLAVPSKVLSLVPGTVISSGAPGSGRIKPGDFLEMEISKIGKLSNPVIAEK